VSHTTDDDLEDEKERKQAEVASSSLASEFISLVIDVFFEQPSDLKKRLAFKEAPTQLDIINDDNTVHCTCFDDGSIIWHKQDHSSNEWRLGSHICSAETKPGFTSSDKDGKGKISLQMIPQYAYELIGGIMQRCKKDNLKINADQWYVLLILLPLYRNCTSKIEYLLTILGNL
jgi:hypothetical protein